MAVKPGGTAEIKMAFLSLHQILGIVLQGFFYYPLQ